MTLKCSSYTNDFLFLKITIPDKECTEINRKRPETGRFYFKTKLHLTPRNIQNELDLVELQLMLYPRKITDMVSQTILIEKTIDFVKVTLADAEGGHDWWHIYRVWKTAKHIAEHENSDLLVVELAALLHDIADSKFHDGDEEKGPAIASEFLQSMQVEEKVIAHVVKIIANVSFKGGKHEKDFKSIELDIVQDADRLDALGAIGIARTFNYGGFKGRAIYNPEIKPDLNLTKEQYKNSTAPTINHFYEKLLLLKDLMNTQSGRIMAEERHKFMEIYLDQFYREWEGEK